MSRRRTGTARTTASHRCRVMCREAYVEPICPIESCVDSGLFDKRAKTREEALSKIIHVLEVDIHHDIAQTRFGTIMLRCLNSVKQGSAKEICLATKVIGLLAVNIGHGDNAHELYEESLSTFSQLGKFEDAFEKILRCLAIITFVGANNFLDTERTMKIVWQLINSKLSSNKIAKNVLAAAISSWTFLLTMTDGWRLDHKYWQGVISYFLNLLEGGEGGSICAVCVEALIIIFEKGNIEKFSSEAYSLIQEDTTSSLQEWKGKVLCQVKNVCDPNWEALKFFEAGYKLETSMNICGNSLKFSTFSQLKKVNFLKQFLGDRFEMHMLENELLQRVFNFMPKNVSSEPELYEPEIEKYNFRYFLPDVRRDKCKQRFKSSTNSPASKAKTQFMKRQRMLAQERKVGDLESL